MFSSNRRRASTVSEADNTDGCGPILGAIGAHPIATNSASSRRDESLVEAIHLCGKCPRNLNRRRFDWRLRSLLIADDALEDMHATHQIIPIHYERRKNAERVLPSSEREQTFVPTALYDFVRRFDYIETPDVAGNSRHERSAAKGRSMISRLNCRCNYL